MLRLGNYTLMAAQLMYTRCLLIIVMSSPPQQAAELAKVSLVP
jgi:hypothetical protein